MSLVDESGRSAASGAMTFDDEGWNTTYEVPAEDLWMLLKDLEALSEWALIEFHPTGIVGRALDKSHVSMGRTVIHEQEIETAGAHCEVGVNVGAIDEFDTMFLASGQDVEIEIDRADEELTVKEPPLAETLEIKPVSATRSQEWIDVEYGTTARMKGWEFVGAVDGACGATDLGFVVEADLNDLNVASCGTPWATTIEGVVTETGFDTARFGSWFWPEITERVQTENDVEVRFGDEKPIVVQIEDRVEYAVAPRITPDDEENGGDAA
ncbi:hypothetical protein [Halorubrum tebenquichense]|uniref:Uncharacterized protein n=1 Tax=Halorubrum tebenquichense DSM 14210 TaxID=1227485 RepID=M0E259_9EURY|nr:hypothetical protein [Halorubrum tebenquichense]ELZ41885.1 hypothetical protein C472_00539 [Halorubrum tebenquichense DSM 14210]